MMALSGHLWVQDVLNKLNEQSIEEDNLAK
jgi:hypothetical protein